MARLPRLQSDIKLATNIKEGLENRAGITHWTYDSMGRVITDAFIKEQGEAHAEQRRAFEAIQISTAAGSDLDDLGMQWSGLRRKTATFASVGAREMNFYFYTVGDTAGAYNDGEGIIIPSGTEVTSRPDSLNNVEVKYVTAEDYYMPPDSSIVYCSARALTMGAGSNVAENVLQYHNVIYSDIVLGTLKCSNSYPILNGQWQEGDEDYRFRIAQKIPAVVQNNLASIRLQGLSLPGIQEVRVLDAYFGVGTVGVVVFGADRENTQQLTQSLQKRLNIMQGPGGKLIATPGLKVIFDFDIRIKLKRELSQVERESLQRGVRRSLINGLKSQEFNSAINLARIGDKITSENTSILQLITNGDSIPHFEAVYIRRTWSSGDGLVERRKAASSRLLLSPTEHVALGSVILRYELEI